MTCWKVPFERALRDPSNQRLLTRRVPFKPKGPQALPGKKCLIGTFPLKGPYEVQVREITYTSGPFQTVEKPGGTKQNL